MPSSLAIGPTDMPPPDRAVDRLGMDAYRSRALGRLRHIGILWVIGLLTACPDVNVSGATECTTTADCAASTDPGTCQIATCVAGVCQVKADPSQDGDQCTLESASPCMTAYACDGGACVGTTPVVCGDNSLPCQQDRCNPESGECESERVDDGESCDDGDLCTAADQCAAGECVGTSRDCSAAGGECATGECGADGDCVAVPTPGVGCTSDDPCITSATCDDGGSCVGSRDPSVPGCGCETDAHCDDSLACTKDICRQDQTCLHVVDDGCLINGTCVAKDAPSPADDCLVCTPVQHALGWSSRVCTDGSECTKDACDPDTGCQFTATPGLGCDDGVACTSGDVCAADATCAGTPTACDDGVACTADSCNPFTGLCISDFSGCPCVDPIACDDHNPCTADLCDPGSGTCAPTPTAGMCDDNNPCSVSDICSDGVCAPGIPKPCDDGIACTADSCDAKSGTCLHQAAGCPLQLKQGLSGVLITGSSGSDALEVRPSAATPTVHGKSSDASGTWLVRPLSIKIGEDK